MPPQNFSAHSQAQVNLLEVMALAAAQGWRAGRDTTGHAGDCPFSHRLPDLQRAWLNGFSAGRTF